MRRREKVKKRLIDPKVRLLLWIYLYGVKDESNWLAKLAKEIDYSEGSLYNLLIDLQSKNLIKSLDPREEGPPYVISDEGKKFLELLIFTRKLGIFIIIWVGLWGLIYYLAFLDNPIFVLAYWLPLLITGFIVSSLILIFYPHLLLKFGKISY